jgi:peroxiredoxin
MTLVKSIKLPLNTLVPDFTLLSPTGESFSLDTILGKKGCIILFTCNHCPYAIAIWKRVIRLSLWAKSNGINTVAINPNIHPSYPEDSADNMIKKIKEWNISFPYLVDSSQETAKAYQAQCTPDLYLVDQTKSLQYHGQFDDNWQNESQVQQNDLKNAIQNLINNKPISTQQYPSMGCSIKWSQ